MPDDRFLFGVEQECLTVAAGPAAVGRLLVDVAAGGPALAGPVGVFVPAGRVYVDGAHVELATAEGASPAALVQLIDKLHRAAAAAAGPNGVLLANCQHAGLAVSGGPSWGMHENYLVDGPPERFADGLLPFLATRVYAGAGAAAADGSFRAGARVDVLEAAVGGGTTTRRALVSTARDEAHLAPGDPRRRCHLILGDAHRSPWSWFLHVGATALVLRLLDRDPAVVRRLPPGRPADWVALAKTANRLAEPDRPPRVHPLAVAAQRVYRDAVAARVALPPWGAAVLDLWDDTLTRLEAGDDDWLARRFDPWIKYRLTADHLRGRGAAWADLPRDPALTAEVALLDQAYHTFAGGDSLWPPADVEPFPFAVADPLAGTRAAPRAAFLREHAGNPDLVMDWGAVRDRAARRERPLADPFAIEYGPWRPAA